MRVRPALAEDYDALAALWREFDHEVPPPTHEGPNDLEKELAEVAEILESEIAFIAEDDDGEPVGFALARNRGSSFGTLTDLFVSRDARRSGIGTELIREVLGAFPRRRESRSSISRCSRRTRSRGRSTAAGGSATRS